MPPYSPPCPLLLSLLLKNSTVDAQKAADALCASASELGSSDNLSAGIVYIRG